MPRRVVSRRIVFSFESAADVIMMTEIRRHEGDDAFHRWTNRSGSVLL